MRLVVVRVLIRLKSGSSPWRAHHENVSYSCSPASLLQVRLRLCATLETPADATTDSQGKQLFVPSVPKAGRRFLVTDGAPIMRC